MTSADRLRDALSALRRDWRRRVLVESAVKVTVAALGAVLLGFCFTVLLGPGSATIVVIRVVGYLLIAAALARFIALPLLRPPSGERFALYVEERAPHLKQALLSAVHELDVPEERRASPSLTHRLIDQALAPVRALATGGALERPRVVRAARVLGGTALAAALAFALGPVALRDAARTLFAPWSSADAAPVFAVLVTPGDATVPRGGAVDVRASLVGFTAEGAQLFFRADSATDWVALPMVRDSAPGTFTSRLLDLTAPTEYYAEAQDVRSAVYRLAVTDLPAVRRLALELRYPAYTGLPPERIEDGGDVAALVGTTVVVRVEASRPVRSGSLRFDRGAAVPLEAGADGKLSGSFRVRENGFYQVDLVAEDGRAVAGSVQYAVEALADRAPTVSIEQPGRDTKATAVEEVTIALRASDDYGVHGLELRYTVNGGEERRIALSDSTRRHAPELRAAHTLFLEEMGVSPGDLVSYHGMARDGAGNVGVSDVYFLEVRPFSRIYRQADEGGGGGGGGGESPEGFVVRQRQIVAGTFNWLRDSSATADKQRREDLATLTIAQGRLREDVTALVRRMAERNVAQADTTFRQIHQELDSAAIAMRAAEERLGRRLAREALPSEERALRHVQRAEALYQEVRLQMGEDGGGGGSGGGQERAEDLADLFQLETDKLRNQYESVQRESEQSAERELDETMERLRQLASRQQQENERMQRMAEALRDRLGRPSSAGGGGGAQRELARQAEEEARRLERLARERNSRELSEAARRLRDAAAAMRRAAGGSTSQGNAALEELKGAGRDLENARSARLSEGIRQLAQRARDLEARQEEIAEGVAALPGTQSEERAERMRRLDERKDALADDVDRLEADAERLSREGRREQPEAASRLGAAAEEIRDQRIRDKIRFSKGVMRGGSSEYANAFEGQIGENLEDAAERLGGAAGALSGESAARRRDRSLERARELVRGVESLRDRMQESREGATAGEGAQSGEGAQAGESEQGGEDGRGATPSAASRRRSSGDARQFTREFRLRRQAAEELRRDVAREGLDVTELDRAIDDLRRLESGRPLGDPRGVDQLQAAVIDGLKTFEFKLYRRLGLSDENRPAQGAPAPVPPEYRALVEEYYRSLGRRERP